MKFSHSEATADLERRLTDAQASVRELAAAFAKSLQDDAMAALAGKGIAVGDKVIAIHRRWRGEEIVKVPAILTHVACDSYGRLTFVLKQIKKDGTASMRAAPVYGDFDLEPAQ